MYDCKRLCSSDVASVIVKLRVLSGADATSGFFGKGEKTVLKNAIKSIAETITVLKDFGQNLVSPDTS